LKELRLGRILGSDGRAVIIAFDHAGFMGPVQGLEEPGKLLDALAGTGVDAVLTTRGIAQRFGEKLGKLGLILRADGGASIASPVMGTLQPLFTVEDALKLGADAIICMGMIGFPEEPSSLQNLAGFTAQALSWGLPVIAEMLVKPKEGETVTAKDIGFAMRIGAELGADVIKASFVRPVDAYRSALKACYRPVVVLGGEKTKNEMDMLQAIADALEAGATGVAIGRNVWQHANPAGVCRALVELVHGSGRVAKALKEIKA
jgi:DhnA-type fructose-1,6-bisphosphate aldolase and related enzymes